MEMRAAQEQLECLLRHLARLNIFPTISANGSHLHFKIHFSAVLCTRYITVQHTLYP